MIDDANETDTFMGWRIITFWHIIALARQRISLYNDCFIYAIKKKDVIKMYRDDNRGGGRFGAPREMHKATCADCGKECEVPFKPDGSKPVYCRDCYQKHRPKRF